MATDDNTRLDRIEQRLGRIETVLAGLATKEDLAGVARNVDITALGRQIGELRDEQRVLSAMVLRLDHAVPDVIEQLRAMVRQQIGIIDRVRALEEPGS